MTDEEWTLITDDDVLVATKIPGAGESSSSHDLCYASKQDVVTMQNSLHSSILRVEQAVLKQTGVFRELIQKMLDAQIEMQERFEQQLHSLGSTWGRELEAQRLVLDGMRTEIKAVTEEKARLGKELEGLLEANKALRQEKKQRDCLDARQLNAKLRQHDPVPFVAEHVHLSPGLVAPLPRKPVGLAMLH